MPHDTQTSPFTGDGDFGDFMINVWLAFARDDCNWVDNRAPVVGTQPDVELWTHRGTVGTPEPPYVFFRTFDDHLMTMTGDGVDTGEEIYDQPGNPANAPASTGFALPSADNQVSTSQRCHFINDAVGPYEAYWLFSDTTGEYIHCVLKVSAREYRHFTVGKLKQIDGGTDLDSDSFYVACTHFWNELGPSNFRWMNTNALANSEHWPYGNHITPFRVKAKAGSSGAFNQGLPNSMNSAWLYMPNLHPQILESAVVNAGGTGHAVDDIITLSADNGATGTMPTLRVTAVTGGVIDTVSVETDGDYEMFSVPSTGITQASTTGSGIDATFDLTFDGWDWYMPQPGDTHKVAGVVTKTAVTTTAVGDINVTIPAGQAHTNAYDGGLGVMLTSCDRNFTANANVLMPIYVSVAFDFQSDIRQGIVASVPDMFRVNMRDYDAEQVISFGGEDYIVFPMINKDSVSTLSEEGYSGWEGIAYRRETGVVV